MNDLPALLSDFGDAAFAVDLDCNILHWNEPAQDVLGFARSQVVGKKCYHVLRGADMTGHTVCRENCHTIQQLKSGNSVPNSDLVVRNASGETRCINTTVIAIRGPSSRPIAVIHAFHDVTRHRQLEQVGKQIISDVERFSSAGLMISTRSTTLDAPDTKAPEDEEQLLAAKCQLTAREREVLELLSRGADRHQIAEELCISPITARNHIESIFAKMGVHNRVEAVVQALKYKLI